jgi:hypothetical protein
VKDEELEALAQASAGDFKRRRRRMEDFRYDEQQERYWDTTTGILLGAKSIDGAIHPDDWPRRLKEAKDGSVKEVLIPPSRAINTIDSGLTCEGSTWWPGRPQFLHNVVVDHRGVVEVDGAACYNSYVAPKLPTKRGDPQPWIDHVKKLYPDPIEHEHFFSFAAHAIQRPDQKVNHGLVMAGRQGIGKDTALMPVRHGVGEWNAAEVGPDVVASAYNGHVRSVLLVINEVRPHDEDFKASNFYNMLKPLLASPPEMLPMTVKYANTIYVRNLCHVVLTTNDPLSMYIPEEDRRLFVMTSPLPDPKRVRVFADGYFDKLHGWLASGGAGYVAKWLAERDLSEFNPTAPPPETSGRAAIVQSAQQVRRTAVDDIFELYTDRVYGGKSPDVIFHRDLIQFVTVSGLFDDAGRVVALLNAKNFHFKLMERGYDMLSNPDANEWARGKYRTRVAFIRKEVPREGRVQRVREELARRPLEMTRAAD